MQKGGPKKLAGGGRNKNWQGRKDALAKKLAGWPEWCLEAAGGRNENQGGPSEKTGAVHCLERLIAGPGLCFFGLLTVLPVWGINNNCLEESRARDGVGRR